MFVEVEFMAVDADLWEPEQPGDVIGWLAVKYWPQEQEAKLEAQRYMRDYGVCMQPTPEAVELGIVEVASGTNELLEPAPIVLKRVFMREQSEVEANIGGQEFPAMVECTSRARDYETFWRVELA